MCVVYRINLLVILSVLLSQIHYFFVITLSARCQYCLISLYLKENNPSILLLFVYCVHANCSHAGDVIGTV